MSSDQRSLEEIVRELPPDLQAKVRRFVKTLLETTHDRANTKLKQNWAGALSDHREKYTSLELQKKSVEWRNE